ncbi:hypothetical protein Tco_0841789 [Tanacetum coccineum]|uniref:Uncharacterized protein n=1 Tax=Tanacetum coccineum TaxID=301880 RepID=A0ABQ5B052_9ASTR
MKVTQQPFNQTRYIPASNMFTEQHFSRTSRVATWAPSLAYVPYRTTASTPLSINRDATWAPMCTIMRWRTDIVVPLDSESKLFLIFNRGSVVENVLQTALVIATCDSRSSSRFSSDRRRSPPLRYSRSPCLPGPHLVAIPDHHLPAVITLLHPEEGTTQGAQVASLLMDKGVEAVVLDVACLIEWLLCYFHWFMLSSKSKEW